MTRRHVRPSDHEASPADDARAGPRQRWGEDAIWDHDRAPTDTSSRTAETLSSVATWIERAQRQLDETAAATNRLEAAAERETRADPKDGPLADALAAIRRIEDKLASQPEQPAPAREPAGFEKALHGLEARFGELAERLAAAPKTLPRRPLKPSHHFKSAVDEILSHQTWLERDPASSRPPSGLPALGTLARSQTAVLTTLNQEVAKLASRIEGIPHRQEQDAKRDFESLQRSMGDMVRREDLSRLERGLQALTDDIMELRRAGEQASGGAEIEGLKAEIMRLSEHRAGPDMSGAFAELQEEMRRLSGQRQPAMDTAPLARGIDGLSSQIEQVRQTLTGASAPQALGLVDQQFAAIRREIAEFGSRQVDSHEFEAMRATIEDLRGSLQNLAGAPPARDLERTMREFGQPIEAVLAALVDKVERVERRVADPEALDQLERQIQVLAGRLGDTPGRDPSVAGLERSMQEILAQVSSWKDGAVQAAQHAARLAVAETLDAMPVAAEVERHLVEVGDRYAAAEERTRQSLAAVQSSLTDVMGRLSSLETGAPRTAEPPPQPMTVSRSSEAVRPATPRPTIPEPRAEVPPLPPEADRPLAPAVDDEVLLEPGASPPMRPRVSDRAAPAPETGETPDIRSSFIAAARRAAQAAAAEPRNAAKNASKTASKSQKDASSGSRASLSPADMIARVRKLIDSKRRPLLLAAAAIVLALGTMQIVRKQLADGGAPAPAPVAVVPVTPAAPQLAASAPPAPRSETAEATAATSPAPAELPEPTTTQSIASAPATPSLAAVPALPAAVPNAKEPARIAEPAPPAPPPAAAQAAARTAPELVDPSVALPVGIRQAADRGNPIALYDLAVRTVEGRGVTRDPKAATALFEKAAEKALAPAQYRLGNAYERGVGVARDLDQAKSWYRRAAEAGNVRAMHNLAVLLADGGGAKPDYQAAVGWFTRAAEHGVKDSQFNLAVLHARGLGTAQDLSRAYHWLALAAQQGDADAGKKRDEVGQRLAAPDLARAKAAIERWRATPALVSANEVLVPPGGFTEPATASKRPAREARV